MVEALVACCVLRSLVYREESVELHSDEDRVQHLSLGVARMDVASLDLYSCSGCIEVLVFKFSDCSAIHCVGIFGAEFSYVKFNDSSSDLLVRGEADLDFSVLELRMIDNILYCIHDFRHSSLIVGSEKGGAVSSDKSLALVCEHFREVAHFERESFNSFERNVASVVVCNDLRICAGSSCIRCSVDVCDEADRWNLLVAV